MSYLILIALFAVAWIVLILPKQRELRRHNALVGSLEVGDEVMTGSGIYGTIVRIDEDTVLLQIAPHTEIKVARRAVAAKVVEPTDEVVDDADDAAGTDGATDTGSDS